MKREMSVQIYVNTGAVKEEEHHHNMPTHSCKLLQEQRFQQHLQSNT